MGRPIKHGLRYHKLYHVWTSMRERCNNPNKDSYKHYGGRGIKVCERWNEFINFYNDMFSTWQEGLELDRVENDSNYEPDNCRWVTKSQNTKNRRCAAKKQSLMDHVVYDSRNDRWSYQRWFKTQKEAEGFAGEMQNG